MLISVRAGDIVDQPDCDAVVNSANRNLRAGSGVCGAIYRAAGPELEACTVRLAPIGLGDAIISPGFRLPNPYIIHTLGLKYCFDENPAGHLALAMRNTLRVAEENQLRRIAVPAISMGVFLYPPEEAVPILVRTARESGKMLQFVQEVRFVVREEALYERFSNEIGKVS
jgi:O-acetyl-ADP-ribose deacetylase